MLEHKNIEKMTAKDLAGVYSEIAEQIGVEDAYKLYLYFRGQQFSLLFRGKLVIKEPMV